MLDDDEMQEFEAIVREAGFDPQDFNPVQEDDALQGEGIRAQHATVTVLRQSNGQATTYQGGHGTNWFVEFRNDLQGGKFGEP